MTGVGKRAIRLFFALLVITSAGMLVRAYAGQATVTDRVAGATDNNAGFEEGERVAPPNDAITVVTTSERITDDEKRENLIVAFDREGRVLYRNDSHVVYNDVDPVPGTRATVLYVAADPLPRSECGGTTDCWRNVVEAVNLTTGEVRVVYERVTAMDRGQWHDVDRVDDTHLLVADIAADRVFVVNTTSGIVTWEWDAQSAFTLKEGGLFPGDWTHVNDVEPLDDGRIMVSLRNQDQVVFLDRETGVHDGWTLGTENDHDTLFEQHNPDYIPEERGGPAVVLADSENDRVVEYERDGDGWKQTWVWRDLHLQWPRDADRLPDGHTLVADSNGRRVIEVDRDGEVVWEVSLNGAYDAERLGTGDESAGAATATDLGLASRGSEIETSPREIEGLSTRERFALAVKDRLPGLVVNAALFVAPSWIGFVELGALAVLVATGLVWAGTELWWSAWSLRVRLVREP
jgi:hypothetical protein